MFKRAGYVLSAVVLIAATAFCLIVGWSIPMLDGFPLYVMAVGLGYAAVIVIDDARSVWGKL